MCNNLILWNQFDLLWYHKEDGIGDGRAGFIIALCDTAELFAKGCRPNVPSGQVFGKRFVLGDSFPIGGVYNWIGQVF